MIKKDTFIVICRQCSYSEDLSKMDNSIDGNTKPIQHISVDKLNTNIYVNDKKHTCKKCESDEIDSIEKY